MIEIIEIESFRIKNYKSIEDSGTCYLEKITILAGKNESGKTAILEALEDFNTGTEIRDEAVPIWDERLKPKITLRLKFTKKDLDNILEKLKSDNNSENNLLDTIIKSLKKFLINNKSLEISKVHPSTYSLPSDLLHNSLGIYDSSEKKKSAEEKITSLIKEVNSSLQNPINQSYLDDYNRLYQYLKQYSPQVNSRIVTEEKGKERIVKKIGEIVEISENLYFFDIFKGEMFKFVYDNLLPNFILFKTFDDIIPDQISISEAQRNPFFKDLTLISNLDYELITSPEAAKREKHKERININFSKEYGQFWTQDHANLFFSWDKENIYCLIKEDNEFYKPNLRSKGRQWHLSFYIKVTARSIEDRKNVLLVDEPGLFLHAKAQTDVLEKLEDCSKRNQIIYSTHSPYLIPADKFDRIRLVIKDENNRTRIEKVTAKADKETLTPILTAIGEDLSIGIRVDRKSSIVVEGFSDYLWLLAFKKLLEIEDPINIIPSVGAGSSVHVGCILFGWGLDPIFLLDNDKAGKTTATKLKKRLAIDESRIIFVPDDKSGNIETLLEKENLSIDPKKKVLAAYEFYKDVEAGTRNVESLNEVTRKNFKRLLDQIIGLLTDNS